MAAKQEVTPYAVTAHRDALKLENVLYEKKGAIAYVTRQSARRCSTPSIKATIAELRTAFEDARDDAACAA